MHQEIQLNIIPFKEPVEAVEFAFYTGNPDSYCLIHKNELKRAFVVLVDESELHYGSWQYTVSAPAKENAIINKAVNIDLLAFDNTSTKRMPNTGTFVKEGAREYLLFNNTRYEESSAPMYKGHHFPAKFSFFSIIAELLNVPALTRHLIDQVYQFSRMFWKSVIQENLPITIKHQEMVAEIFPYFIHDKLPDHGKKSLCFL